MIITSNSITHNYMVSGLTRFEESNGLEKVANSAKICIHSSVSFDHSYEMTVYSEPSNIGGISTFVTENKTFFDDVCFDISLSTSGISTSNFVIWENLEEDQVLQWCFDQNSELIAEKQNEMENSLLGRKDRVLNPKRYIIENPPAPWKVREDEKRTL